MDGVDAGVEGQGDNPFGFDKVKTNIKEGLSKHGFEEGREYVVIKVQHHPIILIQMLINNGVYGDQEQLMEKVHQHHCQVLCHVRLVR